MALDSKEKRASVPGIGRPWYRTKLPGAVDAPWRAASGNVYAGLTYAAAVAPTFDVIRNNPMIASVGKLMGR